MVHSVNDIHKRTTVNFEQPNKSRKFLKQFDAEFSVVFNQEDKFIHEIDAFILHFS